VTCAADYLSLTQRQLGIDLHLGRRRDLRAVTVLAPDLATIVGHGSIMAGEADLAAAGMRQFGGIVRHAGQGRGLALIEWFHPFDMAGGAVPRLLADELWRQLAPWIHLDGIDTQSTTRCAVISTT
jgi:hypothetical protein